MSTLFDRIYADYQKNRPSSKKPIKFNKPKKKTNHYQTKAFKGDNALDQKKIAMEIWQMFN